MRSRSAWAVTAWLVCARALAVTAPDDLHYRWTNAVVGGGGYSPNIVFSSAQAGLAYLRTDIGGIYRYERGATGWRALEDGIGEGNYFGVESLAADPGDANAVYAAVGMYYSGPAAILRSADRGAHWEIVPVPFRMGGNEDGRGLGERLAVDPHDSNILYFGSRHDGLQRSVDRGRTWSKVNSFPRPGLGAPVSGGTHAGISFVLFDPRGGIQGAASRTIFVGAADPGGPHLYRSDDAGTSWQPVSGEPQAGLLPVRAQLDSRGALYIAYCNAIGPNGITAGAVYRLDADTGRWRDISPPAPAGQRGGFMGLALSTAAPGTVLIGTLDWWSDRDTIFRSTDGGEHWIDLRSRSQVDASATPFLRWGDTRASFGWWLTGIAVDPFDDAHVAYTTGATVLTTDAVNAPSVQWRPWVQDMEETAVLALASPSQGPPLLSGFGDIGGFVHEDLQVSPSTMYTQPQFNNTVDIEVAAQAPQIVLRSGTPRRGDASVAWSESFGHSWLPLLLPAQATFDAIPSRRPAPLVAVSADGATFIISQGGVWVTHDRGVNWIRAQGLADNLRIVADQVDPRRFYTVDLSQSRLMVSNDGGEHFGAIVSRGLPVELTLTCRAERGGHAPLFAAPGRLGDLWMSCHDALYHSLDGGRRFQSMAGDLTITELAFGKAAAAGAYPTLFAIGIKNGRRTIWRSDDGASSWFRINDDAHQFGGRFRAISGDPRVFGRVYLGTDGRGLVYGEPGSGSGRLAMGR